MHIDVLFCARDAQGERRELPTSTLRLLLAAFQRILRMNKVPFNLFDKSDLRFRDLQNMLDSVCVTVMRVMLKRRQAKLQSLEKYRKLCQPLVGRTLTVPSTLAKAVLLSCI